jgi:hypothetical protein
VRVAVHPTRNNNATTHADVVRMTLSIRGMRFTTLSFSKNC